MRAASLLVFAVLSLMAGTLEAFDLTKLNLNYQYDTRDEVQLKHRVVQQDGSLKVLFELISSAERLTFTALVQPTYSSESHDTLKGFGMDTLMSGKRLIYELSFPPPSRKNVLILSIGHTAQGVYWLFDVEIGSPTGYPSFYPIDQAGLPIFSSGISMEQMSFSSAGSYHSYQYSEEFGPADPPMGQMKAISPTLKVDSSFIFTDSLRFGQDYSFYLVQRDSTDATGITLLKTPFYFPKLKRIEELVGPLTYITTENEISALRQGPNVKEVFEKFWINSYGTQIRAKGAIRLFYDWVEDANKLFTDYKPGWQTDRGMIYIIFGKPDLVKRTDNSEIWTYGTTEFEFIRIPSLFTPSLYTLKRDIKYDKIWYTRVGAIRKG